MPPDVTAYFQTLAPQAANELRLYERFASTLRSLRSGDAASRGSTAAALRGIQAQLVPLAVALGVVRSPSRLADAHAARARTMKHMASAAREVADALTGDTAPKPKNLAVARQEAEAAESSTRSGANAITAALGVPAGEVATIPVVGPIIAASLLAIAAVLIMIGVIAAKSLEKNAAEKEKGSGRRPARKKEDDD